MNTKTNLETKSLAIKTTNDMKILIVEDDITLTTLWNYIFKLVTPDATAASVSSLYFSANAILFSSFLLINF